MRANGNGNPQICAENLLKCTRGEVPYERLKGLDPSLIDQPANNAEANLRRDIDWLVGTYEPRISAGDIVITPDQYHTGRQV